MKSQKANGRSIRASHLIAEEENREELLPKRPANRFPFSDAPTQAFTRRRPSPETKHELMLALIVVLATFCLSELAFIAIGRL
jgi:hypothetical protein